MTSQLIALGVLALSFFIASVRSVHMGALTLAAALAVGLAAGQSVEDILGGFPVSVVLLLLGVTYLFGIARSNGTLEWIVECVVRRVGDRPALLPWVFFAVSAGWPASAHLWPRSSWARSRCPSWTALVGTRCPWESPW